MKSPTAATVLNCSESEKSLVQLLSSLNQGRAPVNSVAADVQSVDSSYRQNVSGSNGKVAESGCSGGPGNTKTEASFQVDSGRGILDNDYQPERPSRDQAFVCSTAAVDSSPRDRSNVDDRSIEVSKLRKRKSGENDAENGLTARGLPNMASRDAFRAVYRDDSAASQQHVAGQRQQQTGTRPSLKPGDCDKDTASKIELKKNHSSQRLPPAHRRPGRPRKAPSDETAATVLTPQTERKGHQDRRSTTPSKRGRGRPPKRGKRAKGNGEETTGDNYNEEQEGGDGKDEDGAESELDANLDYCEVCEGPGDLVCCDKCPRSFHLKCLHMTETDLPEGDWQCSECKRPSRFDAYSVTVASEKTMQDKCLKIVQCLKSHPFSKQFLSPVENIPMYTRVVKQPMDLSTIENKLKKGAYVLDSNTLANGVKELDATHFANDVRLMWSNCKLFNDDGSGITRAADILSVGFERLYKESTAPPLTAQDGC
uniref:Uncharacterized protein n=1 Tax=Peronospora matthiolae TaxID=2874970 RepID=A0AAV1UL89_9STRA